MAEYITIKSGGEVLKSLLVIEDILKNKIIQEAKAMALNVQTAAKRDCPVDNGTLRNSIYLDERQDGATYSVVVGSKLNYAPYVEFGTGDFVTYLPEYEDFAYQFKGTKKVIGMNAQPFLIPNFEQEKYRFIQRIKQLLTNVKS